MRVQRLPGPLRQGCKLDERISVARVRPRTSKGITDLLLPRTSIGYTPIVPLRSHVSRANPRPNYLAGRGLVRYRNKPDKSLHQLRTAMHHHPQNQERSSICQSSLSLDLVSFPVLGQIKPQAPLLVVPFRQFL